MRRCETDKVAEGVSLASLDQPIDITRNIFHPWDYPTSVPTTLENGRKSYPGGKGGAGVYQAIINQMPPHDTYIEAFLGSGAVLRHKRPATSENIGIDLDAAAIAKFGDAAAASEMAMPAINLLNVDAIDYLAARQRWTGRELIYCDPPYLLDVRRSRRRRYRCELLTEDDHRRLLYVLTRLPCMVMVSGYASALYSRELVTWRLVTFQAMTRRGPATEHLWCNFPAPIALHDYRYLGRDFRERERIARKARRWRAKLDQLGALERQAVLSACVNSAPAIL